MTGQRTSMGGPRRVVVTGASRGIGRAIALAFAESGDRVALLARDSPQLAEAAELCLSRTTDSIVVHADVTDVVATGRACDEIHARWGGIDILVNNAGMGRYAPFMELTARDWSDMLSTNLLGTVNVIRSVIPGMVNQGSGHIVNISSVRGIETIPGTTAYAASKFGVVGLTQALRQELDGTGVVVSMIYPGGVKTGFGGIASEDKDSTFLDAAVVADLVVNMVAHGSGAWIRDLTIMPYPPATNS